MTFPTIPTSGAGRVLGLNQANTTAVRTFPDLSGLTKSAGDLLIAIVVGHQTSTGTNAAFSGWTAGWTEFHDSASATTMAIGMAYKWSTGSETGTIAVTQAGTITGHASMILLSIPGAHASTPPEAGSRASGTGAANPASFDPSGWATEDTLWIAVGASGEDAITGTWTGMGSAPTNYTNYFDTATTDSSTVGQTELAVAFRQLNASSEDVGAFTGNDTSNARDAAVVIAVRPKPPTTTPVAEISLATHATPSERTNHSIKIRARTTSGSTGVIRAALYEGATNRSGDLSSSALTNSLVNYTLVIPDASAANITDYSNLSLRVWGYDVSGGALVFEVADLKLNLPTPAPSGSTLFGATAMPVTFGKAVAGVIVASKSTPVVEISLASHGIPAARTNHSIKIRARTTSGSTGVIKAALYEGATNRSGDITSSALTNVLADYTLNIPDASAANITDYSNLSIKIWGYDSAGQVLVFQIARLNLSLPPAITGSTLFGATAMPITFGKAVAGVIVAPKSTAVAEISLASHGIPSARTGHSIKVRARTTSGSTGVIKAALYEGTTNRSGDITSGALTNSLSDYTLGIPDASAANITDYSNLSIRIWGYDPAGQPLVFEVAKLYLNLPVPSGGATTYFGATAMPITFGKAVAGVIVPPKSTAVAEISLASHGTPATRTNHSIKIRARTTSGSTGIIRAALYEGATNRSGDLSSSALTNSLADYTLVIPDASAANITDYSNLSIKIWGYDPAGQILVFQIARLNLYLPPASGGATTYFGVVAAPFTFTKDVIASRKTFGVVAAPFTFTKAVGGVRTAFGAIVAPFTFGKAVSGIRVFFGVVAASFTFSKVVVGSKSTFGSVVAPFTFTKAVSGVKTSFGAIVAPFTFTKAVLGAKKTFGVVAASFTFTKAVAGAKNSFGVVSASFTFVKDVSGAKKTFGAVVAPFTFTKAVSGVKIAVGQIAMALTFTKAVSGTRKTFSSIVAPFTFGKVVAGVEQVYGQVAAVFTFTKSVSGTRKTFSQIVAPFTFTKSVGGVRTALGTIVAPFTFTKAVVASKKTFSSIFAPFTFVKDVSGTKKTFGVVTAPFTFVKDVVGRKTTYSQIVAPFTFAASTIADRLSTTYYGVVAFPITFVKAVTGRRMVFGQVAVPITFTKAVSGVRNTFGVIAAPFTFGKAVLGSKKTFSSIVAPFSFTKAVLGSKKTFSSIVAPFIFSKSVVARKTTYSQTTLPITFTKAVVGQRKTFSSLVAPFTFTKAVVARKSTFARIDLPVTFVKATAGRKQTYSQVAFPLNMIFSVTAEVQGIRYGATSMSLIFGEVVQGQRKTFGQVVSPYLFSKSVLGQRKTFSSLSAPFLFAPSVQGKRTTFGRFDRPFVFTKEVTGRKSTFGQIAFPINANVVVTGRRQALGQIAMGLVFGEQTAGQRKAFGQIATPYLFAATSQGTKSTFGKIDTDIDFLIDVDSGHVQAFSQLALEILMDLETAGFVRPRSIILNLAANIYLNSTPVESVYAGDQKVWPPTI